MLSEKHKAKRRRGWRKLHLAIDPYGNVVACKLTDHLADNAQTVPDLLEQMEGKIKAFRCDGAYYRTSVLDALRWHNDGEEPEIRVPPRRDAAILARPENQMDRSHGVSFSLTHSGTMFRYKESIGRKLKARSIDNQEIEAAIGVKLLNWMWSLGMPITEEMV